MVNILKEVYVLSRAKDLVCPTKIICSSERKENFSCKPQKSDCMDVK